MIQKLTKYEALKQCVEKSGSQESFADNMGVTQPTVWRWLRQSKQLPPEYVLEAERLYGVSRHNLRPDIYPRDYPAAPENRFYGIDQTARGAA